ncbi:(2E,6E)-farnesyl diphosphate synthase [Thioflexithrix psekupsensis]|uniref:(2E,6E)-farnesyl diphosphate synthase n=1 Tax=Thioflexithrix psekupsensis TaxID=1570016 RepID=A0A251XBH6_9GAMM|nr:farnesyl diphosphate synthase [Thioflexithrix psekupsensis]OUD15684.1 (2E,6E)-farnesyl diphosphate synthase [Thioflexithrix psekupsensis]
MSLKELMRFYQQRAHCALDRHLPSEQTQPDRLHQAMRYSVLNGGKRIRPLLVYLTGQAFDIKPEILDIPAVAVELIHAYSLIHDDLPAMDDDDLRRGKPTCHKAFDEATAILAGDALQTLAFYVLSAPTSDLSSIDLSARLRMIAILAQASGSRGMVGGQAIDMAATGQVLNLAELENMHIHKTGALIRASVQLGALTVPEMSESALAALDYYAKCIGLAFQIQDDILDVSVSTEILGKMQGADQANHKPTYPSIVGLEESRLMAEQLVKNALASLSEFDQRADPLRWIAKYIIERGY